MDTFTASGHHGEAAQRVPTHPMQDRELQALVDSCVRFGRHQPQELLRWLVNDVLAGFGIPLPEHHPADAHTWIQRFAASYASIAARHPFADVLGHVYQSIGSRGHRGALGQFFTPAPVAALMASILTQGVASPKDGRLLRVCEPACGSGALVLAFMQAQVQLGGNEALRRWSFTAIDLDSLCARMCAAQVLSNLYLQRLELGELVVYQGNALGPRSGLSTVVHATVADLTPDVVLPAMHPSRLAALHDACMGRLCGESTRPIAGGVAATVAQPVGNAGGNGPHQVDLFADC